MSKQTDLSKEQLLELVCQQTKQLAQNKDTIKQLESKLDQKQRDYLKLWQERFGAKSERYMADPDQLKLDFGDTAETEDVAAGIYQANEQRGSWASGSWASGSRTRDPRSQAQAAKKTRRILARPPASHRNHPRHR